MEVHRFWKKGPPAAAEETPDVHGEVTQFLGGQLLENFYGNRQSAPDWIWVSVLALPFTVPR